MKLNALKCNTAPQLRSDRCDRELFISVLQFSFMHNSAVLGANFKPISIKRNPNAVYDKTVEGENFCSIAKVFPSNIH